MAQSWSGTGLPPAAAARMAEIAGSGTWGSALSTDEFAAIRSAGLEPAGQVLGAAVYSIGDPGSESCPAGEQASVLGRLAGGRAAALSAPGPIDSFRSLVTALYQARRQAIGRMAGSARGSAPMAWWAPC
ncbi:MAG: hypothetical protein ACLPN6_01570 [Streptosporangiaceae bacterium]